MCESRRRIAGGGQKAASLVEYNAPDYVDYLKRVYSDAPEATIRSIERWGKESNNGLALARWAELADPSFDFNRAFARFRTLYRPAHFDGAERSVRGSKRGEMIARCVVEVGHLRSTAPYAMQPKSRC